jgi:hypothetical protein
MHSIVIERNTPSSSHLRELASAPVPHERALDAFNHPYAYLAA